MNIELFIGFPGSGKSTLMNTRQQELSKNNENVFLLDDLSVLVRESKLNVTDFLNSYLNQKIDHLLISDIFLVSEKNFIKMLDILSHHEVEILSIYFFDSHIKDAIKICKKNIQERQKNGDERKVDHVFEILGKENDLKINLIELIVKEHLNKCQNIYIHYLEPFSNRIKTRKKQKKY